SAERQTTLGGLAQELVQLNVDVIVAGGAASAQSAKAATQTIAIVGVGVGGDPLAMGLPRASHAPGGTSRGSSTRESIDLSCSSSCWRPCPGSRALESSGTPTTRPSRTSSTL